MKTNSAPPVWLFTGPEIGERNTAVEQIRAVTAKRCGNLDSHTLYASDVKMGEVVSLLQNGSLFADARFVVLRYAEMLKKKDDIDIFLSWVEESSGITDAVLILVSDEIGIDKKIENVIPKDQKRIFWELFENRKEQWITEFFKKAGYTIDSEAVSSILDLVENNTEALRSACSRFTLFFPEGHRISEEDTENMLSHNREESAFTLFDTMGEGDFAGALEIQRKLSLSKESSPVQTIAGLSFCFRRLGDWHTLAVSGSTDDFSLKKAGFTSKRSVDQYRRAAKKWDAVCVQQILALLASSDLAIRSGGGAVQDIQMESCLYAIMAKSGRALSCAEYD